MLDGWINRFFQRGVSNIRINRDERDVEQRFEIRGDLRVKDQQALFIVSACGFCLTSAILEFQKQLDQVKAEYPMVIME